jgi:cytochrome c1
MTEQAEQALIAYADRQARALEAIKIGVWVLAGFAIAAVVLYLSTAFR